MKHGFKAWLLTALACVACAGKPILPETVRARQGEQTAKVIVLKSSANPLFERPIQGFLSRFDGEVQVFSDVTRERAPMLARKVVEEKPDLVLCLGNKAAALAKATIHDTWVLFVAVPSAREMGLHTLPNFTGILMEPRPLQAFSQFRMVDANLKSVLTFYSPQMSGELIDAAKMDLESMGINLMAVPTRNLDEIKAAFAANIDNVDAVWMPADPVVVNPEAFGYLRDASLQANKVLLTSLTEKFAEQGALMSTSLDLTSLGSQAALLARRALDRHGVRGGPLAVQNPISVKLAVNLHTAALLHLTISPDVLPYINRVYAGHP